MKPIIIHKQLTIFNNYIYRIDDVVVDLFTTINKLLPDLKSTPELVVETLCIRISYLIKYVQSS